MFSGFISMHQMLTATKAHKPKVWLQKQNKRKTLTGLFKIEKYR